MQKEMEYAFKDLSSIETSGCSGQEGLKKVSSK